MAVSGLMRVPRHVEQRRRDVLGERESLIESSRLLDLVDEILRHRLAGLMVPRVAREHRRLERPVFIEL